MVTTSVSIAQLLLLLRILDFRLASAFDNSGRAMDDTVHQCPAILLLYFFGEAHYLLLLHHYRGISPAGDRGASYCTMKRKEW